MNPLAIISRGFYLALGRIAAFLFIRILRAILEDLFALLKLALVAAAIAAHHYHLF